MIPWYSKIIFILKGYFLSLHVVANRGSTISTVPIQFMPELGYKAYADKFGQFYADHVGTEEECRNVISAYENDKTDSDCSSEEASAQTQSLTAQDQIFPSMPQMFIPSLQRCPSFQPKPPILLNQILKPL